MSELPAYPGRRTAPSAQGPYKLHTCVECGRRAYLPAWRDEGERGHCSRCEQSVEWRRGC